MADELIIEKLSTEDEIDELYANKRVAISNALMQAKSKNSLLESKIELLSQYKLANKEYLVRTKLDAEGKQYSVHHVKISVQEVRVLSGRKGGSLYSDMMAVAQFLSLKRYVYIDRFEKKFKSQPLYTKVEYTDGILDIEFNPDTEFFFMELQDGSFTQLRLDIAFKFTTNGGFQLYKALISHAFQLGRIDSKKTQSEQFSLQKYFKLSELRMVLGYIDLDQVDIIVETEKSNPDFDKIAELDKKKKFKRWGDLQAKVIDPGIKEINTISDLYISNIIPEKGPHGKVIGLYIEIQRNKAFYEKNKNKTVIKASADNDNSLGIKLSDEEKDDIVFEVMRSVPEIEKGRDARSIAEAAEYDKAKINKAIEVMKGSTTKINNPVAFLIKAIRESWEPSAKVIPEQKKNQAGSFGSHQQTEYDYDELEKRLEERTNRYLKENNICT